MTRSEFFNSAMYRAQSDANIGGEVMLIVGVIVQYVGTRFALGFGPRAESSSPIWRAAAQWLPIATTALAAAAMRQFSMAVELAIGSSVACLSLVLGLSSYVSPMRELSPPRRLWPLVLPAALFVLLAGFHGSFAWYHALMLLAMGLAFLPVWIDRPLDEAEVPYAVSHAEVGRSVWWLGPLCGAALCALGAWAAARGSVLTSEHHRVLGADLMAATVLSPLLLLPALGAATMAAQQGQMGQVVTSLCGTVLLNLCVLLPAIILLSYLADPAAHSSGARLHSAPFPLITWRIDCVVLVMLAFSLVPVALGRWLPGRVESILLVVVYAVYLMAQAALATRLVS